MIQLQFFIWSVCVCEGQTQTVLKRKSCDRKESLCGRTTNPSQFLLYVMEHGQLVNRQLTDNSDNIWGSLDQKCSFWTKLSKSNYYKIITNEYFLCCFLCVSLQLKCTKGSMCLNPWCHWCFAFFFVERKGNPSNYIFFMTWVVGGWGTGASQQHRTSPFPAPLPLTSSHIGASGGGVGVMGFWFNCDGCRCHWLSYVSDPCLPPHLCAGAMQGSGAYLFGSRDIPACQMLGAPVPANPSRLWEPSFASEFLFVRRFQFLVGFFVVFFSPCGDFLFEFLYFFCKVIFVFSCN